MTPDSIRIRRATPLDFDLLVDFTIEEAREAEDRPLTRADAERGVRGGLLEGAIIGYWVAEDVASGSVLASASAYAEWSDWSGAPYWWVQSVYVTPPARGRRLATRLLDEISAAAGADGAVELRLHVHRDNTAARAAYARSGFSPRPYVVLGRRLGPSAGGTTA